MCLDPPEPVNLLGQSRIHMVPRGGPVVIVVVPPSGGQPGVPLAVPVHTGDCVQSPSQRRWIDPRVAVDGPEVLRALTLGLVGPRLHPYSKCGKGSVGPHSTLITCIVSITHTSSHLGVFGADDVKAIPEHTLFG